MGGSFKELLVDFEEFLKAKYNLVRLDTLEALSKFLGILTLVLVVVLFTFATLFFIAVAMGYLLAQWLPMWGAFLIVAGVFLILIGIAFLLRRRLFFDPLVRLLSGILFASEKGDEDL